MTALALASASTSSTPGQDTSSTLPGLETAGRGRARRVEKAVMDATALVGFDNTRDAAAAALAVELGRAVDVAATRQDPYGVATAARELSNALQRLKLDPASREGDAANGHADFVAWLNSSDDDVDQADGGAALPDAADA